MSRFLNAQEFLFGALAAAIVLSTVFPPVSAVTYGMTLKTDMTSYSGVQPIVISGAISPSPGPNTGVIITIRNSANIIADVDEATPSPTTGAFNYTSHPGGSSAWTSGPYTVNATWGGVGGTVSSVVSFTYSAAGTTSTTTSTTSSTSATTSTTSSSTTTTASSTPATTTTTVQTTTSSSTTSTTTTSTVPEFPVGALAALVLISVALVAILSRKSASRIAGRIARPTPLTRQSAKHRT